MSGAALDAGDPSATPAAGALPDQAKALRHDGWQPDRRRAFLEAIAEGHTVAAACRTVGLSAASAYALRRRDAGFALGWNGAALLAREALADILYSRAIDGQVDTYTRADGAEVTRHRFDNRLGQAMLARLDRLAETLDDPRDRLPGGAGAAREVAAAFEAYLDLVAGDAAAAALVDFPCEQARRTSQLRQLDARAEAVVAPADDDPPAKPGEAEPAEPFWFDHSKQQWRTALPPPPRFRGHEWGEFGDEDYHRALSRAEREVAEARHEERTERRRAAGERELARWFGGTAPAPASAGIAAAPG